MPSAEALLHDLLNAFAQAPWAAGGLVAAALSGSYALLMLAFRWGWTRTPETDAPAARPRTRVTVIVPARDEAGRIGHCIRALKRQDYPAGLVQILVVDDHSRDGTAEEAREAGGDRVLVLSLRDLLRAEPANRRFRAYKKWAIERAVARATGELIVTTDADARPGESWLSRIVGAHERHGWQLLAGPVAFYPTTRLLGRFQELDFLSLVGIAGASIRLGFHNLCNGANLAYTREAFLAVGGYRGLDDLPSGDDLLLMHRIARHYPGRVGFLKDRRAVVYTRPEKDLAGFWQQRLRWAGKSTRYEDRRITLILAGVWLFNLAIPAFWVLGVVDAAWFRIGLLMFLIKIAADTLFQAPVVRFFRRTQLLWSFLPLQLLHLAYVIVIGPWSTFGGYRWKGRTVEPPSRRRLRARRAAP
jgi:cellulose synthase/poly-beta-1,6-N-acetylglucosamine synthase-like glycosyltransferase